MSVPGPTSKTSAIEPALGPIPGPPTVLGQGASLDTLTPDEIKARLAARERDLKYHIQALKHEATTVLDDIVVDGQPLIDRIRQRPAAAFGGAAAVGALLGVLLGLRSRSKHRIEPPEAHILFVQARMDAAIDEAAHRVARGESVDAAMQRSMKTMPAVFCDSKPPKPIHGRQTLTDVAMTTAMGFAVKTALDMLTKRFTDSDETFEALAEAAE